MDIAQICIFTLHKRDDMLSNHCCTANRFSEAVWDWTVELAYTGRSLRLTLAHVRGQASREGFQVRSG